MELQILMKKNPPKKRQAGENIQPYYENLGEEHIDHLLKGDSKFFIIKKNK